MEVLAAIRDIAIILLALLNIAILIALGVLIFLVYKLVGWIRAEVPEVLGGAKSTAASVRGTAEFVGETAVTPVIRIVAVLAALSRFVAVLFGGERRRVP